MADDQDTPSLADSEDEKIVKEAKRRFKRCQDYESKFRRRFVEDLKFANGDSDNLWQWDDTLRSGREEDDRPCLTINKIRQHNLNIINDAKKNKPGVRVRPVGNQATYDAAEVYEGIIRHIEYQSNATTAYDTATTFQVEGGIGYWRIATDYADDESFDQEIFIRRVKDPLSIYLDPDIKEIDGSDARFGFVFDDMARDEFEARYPEYKDKGTRAPLGDYDDTSWISDDKVRVAEYFRVVEKKDRLIALTDPLTGLKSVVKVSKVPKVILDKVSDDPTNQDRTIVTTEVERFLIIGDQIAERNIWPGKYIPIVRVIGEEIQIEGQLDRWGHTRAGKDPQRMYNYWSSSAVEMVALQSKTPYIGPMAAFEGLETYWEDANRVNTAWLPYNGYDDKGNPTQRPERQAPPVMAQAYLQGMQIASEELRAVTGQFQADLGMPSNETSGVAIMQRQRQGDAATYHYIDNLAIAIRYTGKQLIDLIPKIYDTPRIIKILGEDGAEREVEINPQAKLAYLENKKRQGEEVRGMLNPSVGKYDVESDVGPGYATKRQEAFDAFVKIASQSPEIMKIAGDLMFKTADFPMANELADRFRKIIPPAVLGEGPSPSEQQLQGKLQQAQQLLSTVMEQLAEEKRKRTSVEQQKNIDAYRATTDRMKVIPPGIDVSAIQALIRQEIQDALTNPLSAVTAASQPALMPDQGTAPQPVIPNQPPEFVQ